MLPDRLLPHNLEAERVVLGAVLVDNAALMRVLPIIQAPAFFRDAHRRIFLAITTLSERGDPFDLVTLKDLLGRLGELEDVGGPAYLGALIDGIPLSFNVEKYADIVKDNWLRRQVIFAGGRMTADGYDGNRTITEILGDAERTIFGVSVHRSATGFTSLGEIVRENFPRIEAMVERRGLAGVPTHLEEFNRLTRGFQPGDLVIVAGRPSMGKTSLVLDWARYIVSIGGVVGFFSLEMSKAQLLIRLIAAQTGLDAHAMQSQPLTLDQQSAIARAMEALAEEGLYVDDTAAMGLVEMRAKARRLKSERGLSLLVVDYVQLMATSAQENRTQALAAISAGLKALGKELDVPVIALSQLSRAPESRSDKRPMLSDLRESGALEQDGDVVVFIFREDMYRTEKDGHPEGDGITELIIAKQRNGPTGTVKTAFLKGQTRFISLCGGVV